jgi:molecular chaperone GrpE (heat shock protein)
MSSKEILSVIAASMVLVAGGVWLIRRKINGRVAPGGGTDIQTRPDHHDFTEDSGSTEPQKSASTRVPEISPQPKSVPPVELLEAVAMRIADSDLCDFMKDITTRVREEGPDYGEETSLRFIEEMVDRLDDLRTIHKNHQGQTAKDVELFRQTLAAVLTDCGIELIHSDKWDPSIQRAIAKEPTPGIDTPTILRFGSTGIRRHDQLVRKQEVVLAVPL